MKVWNMGEEVEIDPKQAWLIDRSRISDGLRCSQLRYLGYEWNGRGIQPAKESEDTALGSAVHLGLETALQGGEGAAQIAKEAFLKRVDDLIVQGDRSLRELMPEVFELLVEEQAHLAWMLVKAFEARALPRWAQLYELESTEEEINWLLGELEDGTPVVVMSRVDAVLRRLGDKELVIGSFKTKKENLQWSIDEQQIDTQVDTEMLAVEARYGEIPAGVQYMNLMKGEKRWDAALQMKRYRSSLIRPWFNVMSADPTSPSNYKLSSSFVKSDGSSGRLGKGWEQVSIWKQLEMEEWFQWLASGQFEIDLLEQTVIEPPLVEPSLFRLERWRRSALQDENARRKELQKPRPLFRQDPGGCFKYNSKCKFYEVCWEGKAIESLYRSPEWKEREYNHQQEKEGTEDAN